VTPLTPEQQALAAQWMPYAFSQANKYAAKVNAKQWSNLVDVEDLAGVALYAACEAAARFDPSRSGSLGTLLTLILRQKLHHEVCRQKACGFGALASALGDGRLSFEAVPKPASLEAPAGNQGKYAELLAARDGRPSDFVADDVAKLRAALPSLPQPVRGVVEARMHGYTLAQIGQHIGLSKERVRQLEQKGRKLLGEVLGAVPRPQTRRRPCARCGRFHTLTARQAGWAARGHLIYCSESCRRAAGEVRRIVKKVAAK
jgi:RNA polymerase sigma factor (sigma-70 family)